MGEKLGLWSSSPEPYLSCSLLLSDNPALLPSTEMQQQLPGLQTSIHYPREVLCCGTGSSSRLVTGLDITQGSGSAFSSIFYRILEQVNFRRVLRWVLQGFSFPGITEAKSRKGGSAFSSRIEQHHSFKVPSWHCKDEHCSPSVLHRGSTGSCIPPVKLSPAKLQTIT